MTKKLQLNLRMDKEPELLQNMKEVAAENDMSLNDLAIAAFKAIVELRSPVKLSTMVENIKELKTEVDSLKNNWKNLDERLKRVEVDINSNNPTNQGK